MLALIEKLETEQARAHSSEQKVEELIDHLEILQVGDSERDLSKGEDEAVAGS